MHKYERFIIYPLLIVALFLSFGGYDFGLEALETAERVVTDELVVMGEDMEPLVEIGTAEDELIGEYGYIEVKGQYAESELTNSQMSFESLENGFKSSLSTSNLSIVSDDHEVKIGSHIDFDAMLEEEEVRTATFGYNQFFDDTPILNMGPSEGEGGMIEVRNNRGNLSVVLSRNPDDHGLINVFDRYGDDWTSYGFRPGY